MISNLRDSCSVSIQDWQSLINCQSLERCNRQQLPVPVFLLRSRFLVAREAAFSTPSNSCWGLNPGDACRGGKSSLRFFTLGFVVSLFIFGAACGGARTRIMVNENLTVVYSATLPELTTWLAKTGIREDRGRGFRPLGSNRCDLSFFPLLPIR